MHLHHDAELLILLEQFLAYLRVERGLSPNTVSSYGSDLRQFFLFLHSLGIEKATLVARGHISDYCKERTEHRASAKSLHRHLCAIRRYFLFLRKEEKIAISPAHDIALPKVEKKL